MGISDLHTFFIYVFFGYFLIFPAVLLCLKLFQIESPRQRIQIYLLALATPFVGFILYHTVLTKRCDAGIIFTGPGWQLFNSLCLLGIGALRFLGPLLVGMLIFGLLKAVAGSFYVARIRRREIVPAAMEQKRVAVIISRQSARLGMRVPEVLYCSRDGFVAFATGVGPPLVVVSAPLLAQLEDSELEGILTHELIHILRGDTLTGWFVHLARDAMFFSPFSTMLLDRYLLERERLCDGETVQMLGTGRVYAATLLKVWRLLLDRREFKAGLAPGFTGNKRDLELRITSLLGGEQAAASIPNVMFYTLLFALFTITVLYLGLIC